MRCARPSRKRRRAHLRVRLRRRPRSGQARRRWARSPRALADRVVVTSDNPRSEDPARDHRQRSRGIRARRRNAVASSSIAATRFAAAVARGRGRRRRAGRRQGPRDLPGDARRAHAVLRCRGGAQRRSMQGARAHDGHARRPRDAIGGRTARRQRALRRACRPTRARCASGDLSSRCKGERFDGHDFVGIAHASAAPPRRSSIARSCRIALPAADRRRRHAPALGELARALARALLAAAGRVVGSNGKTTVKEMLASILRAHLGDATPCSPPRGNLNNDIGVPLTLLRLRDDASLRRVIELGMNHRGEIARARRHRAADGRRWSTTRSASTRNSCRRVGRGRARSMRRSLRALPRRRRRGA